MIEREGGQEGDNVCVRGREKAGKRERVIVAEAVVVVAI